MQYPAIYFVALLNLLETTDRQQTCEANLAGENSSFIFTVCVKSAPLYHFKLAFMQFCIWLSKNFSIPTSKNGEINCFNLRSHL